MPYKSRVRREEARLAWRIKNKEKLREQRKIWEANNQDKLKQYRLKRKMSDKQHRTQQE
jgi:hypothetical protein